MTSIFTAKNESHGTLPPPYSTRPNAGVVESIRHSFGRVLGSDRPNPPPSDDRSVSRGRDFASTGRGGAGNFVRSSSTSQARVVTNEPSTERGRELPNNPTIVFHAGRGGAGNIRSPSRDTEADRAAFKRDSDLIHKHEVEASAAPYFSGRGGSGNIHSPTRDNNSRSRSREPGLSAGRGGAGNIIPADGASPRPSDLERLDEEDRREHQLHKLGHEAIHSHGRGGAGNIDDQVILPVHNQRTTHVANNTYLSTGRGGAGNFGH